MNTGNLRKRYKKWVKSQELFLDPVELHDSNDSVVTTYIVVSNDDLWCGFRPLVDGDTHWQIGDVIFLIESKWKGFDAVYGGNILLKEEDLEQFPKETPAEIDEYGLYLYKDGQWIEVTKDWLHEQFAGWEY